MPRIINKRLREGILNSAIKQSLIPVFICDENFRICLKSIGAERFFPRPIVNSSVLAQLPEDIVEKTEKSEIPLCTVFKLPKGEVYTIITTGVFCGEKYYALVFEPRIMFSSEPIPWYIAESYTNLSNAVYELLTSPKEDFTKLDRCCSQILRLADFWEHAKLPEARHSVSTVNLYGEIRNVIDECSTLLSVIGASVSLEKYSDRAPMCTYPGMVLHIFASVLFSASIILSTDGRARVLLQTPENSDSEIEMTVSVNCNRAQDGITQFEELCNRVKPLRLELAALMDMAKRYGINLSCHTDSGKLTITCRFAAYYSPNVRFHAPLPFTMPTHVRNMISGICEIAVHYRKLLNI